VLFFNKPKLKLIELIPNNFVDIHSHVMHGIDDGAKTPEDTLFLIRSLSDMGFTKFITTPHTFSGLYDNTKQIILNKEIEIQKLLVENQLEVPLFAASEYLLDTHFIELCRKKELIPIKDNFVLVEMSYLNPPIQLYDFLFEMQVAGYKPILAHPERYVFYHKKFDEYRKLKNAGCLFQLNLLSTVGYYGKIVTEIANQLLKSGLIDFVGSDVHHKKHIEAFDKKLEIKEVDTLKDVISNNQFFI
jgi:protein-tyrosine phosphatase